MVPADPHALRELRHASLPCIALGATTHVRPRTLLILLNLLAHRPTLSYQRLQVDQPLTDQELYDKIRKAVPNKHELQVLESFLIFNK